MKISRTSGETPQNAPAPQPKTQPTPAPAPKAPLQAETRAGI